MPRICSPCAWATTSTSRTSRRWPELTNLTTLVLNQNQIRDISPLAGMVNMMDLDIHHNQIRDISALSGMTKLRMLAIRENPIRDISPLAGIVGVKTLILSCTEVNDISPLLAMRSLEHLDLRECPLDRSAYDIYIPQIHANNPGVQIRYDPLREYTVKISSSAGGAVTCPGEGEFTFETGQIILLIAKPNPGCVFQSWSGTFTSMREPDLRRHLGEPRDPGEFPRSVEHAVRR